MDEIRRNTTVALHAPPGDDETVRAVIRTHVCFNLLVRAYGKALSDILDTASESKVKQAAAQLILQCLNEDDEEGEGGSKPSKKKSVKPKEAARTLYGVLLTKESVASGLGHIKGGAGKIDDAIAAIDSIAVDRENVRKREVWSKVYTRGNIPSWVCKSEGTESGFAPKPNWDDKREKAFQKWCREKREFFAGFHREDDPRVVLYREGGTEGRLVPHAKTLLPSLGGVTGEFLHNAFSTAISAISAYQTQVRRREDLRRSRKAECEEMARPLTAEDRAAFERYEVDARAHFEQASGHRMTGPYVVGLGGEVRDFGRIRKSWLKLRWREGGATFEELRAARIEVQKKRKTYHGDARLFDWLAQPEQWFLWDGHEAPTPADREAEVYDKVTLRAKVAKKSRHLSSITRTFAHPLDHPLWSAYRRGRGGSNCVGITFEPFDAPKDRIVHGRQTRGRHAVMPLLCVEGGRFEEKEYAFGLGLSHRIVPGKGDSILLAGTDTPVTIGGMALRIDRDTLRHAARTCDPEVRRLLSGYGPWSHEDIERIVDALYKPCRRARLYLSIALTLTPKRTPEKLRVFFKSKASTKEVQHALQGERVLGVDLGTRVAASLAAVHFGVEGRGRAFQGGLVGQIRATHHVILDGEAEQEEARALGRATGVVRQYLCVASTLARRVEARRRGVVLDDAPEEVVLEDLPECCRTKEIIASHTTARKRLVDPGMGDEDRLWSVDRLLQRVVARIQAVALSPGEGKGGLSLERIEALQSLVRALRAYGARCRLLADGRLHRTGAPRGFGRGFTRLNAKINRLKKDRCRKVAAAIVAWALDHECGVIAFEDLSRYKFSYDRPSSENRRLQQWSHQTIIDFATGLAKIHGIVVRTVSAGYSSRFVAVDRAPGLRCGPFQKWYLTTEWWQDLVAAYPSVTRAQEDKKLLVPNGSGEQLVSLTPEHALRQMHADTNAAAEIAFRLLAPPTEDPIYLRLERAHENDYVVTSTGVLQGCRMRLGSDGALSHIDGKEVVRSVTQDEEGETTARTKVVRAHRDPTGVIMGGRWVLAPVFWSILRHRVMTNLFPSVSISSVA